MNPFAINTGEEREVGQSWTGGLAQGCAPVFQPFGEPGKRTFDDRKLL